MYFGVGRCSSVFVFNSSCSIDSIISTDIWAKDAKTTELKTLHYKFLRMSDFIGDHKNSVSVCGVLLHIQETRQDRPERDADLWGGRAFGEQDHGAGAGP